MNRIEKGTEKVLNIMKIACSVIVIVLALVQHKGIWNKAINVFEPLLGIIMVIQAIQYWEKREN